MAETAAIRDFPCSVCGAPVGSRESHPPRVPRAAGRGGEDPGRRPDRCVQSISNGNRAGDRVVTPEELTREVEALGGEGAGTFLALDCRSVQLAYCFGHWTVEFSDEPPVSFSRCPHGHGRAIVMG